MHHKEKNKMQVTGKEDYLVQGVVAAGGWRG
jgi:hypothetical protein